MRKKWDRGKGLNCINSTIRRNADNKKTSENQGFRGFDERRRPDLNRWILVLQTIALPLGYVAVFIFLCWLRASEQGVADPRLTAWLCRHIIKLCITASDSDGNRTRVTAVKGRCLNRLTTEPIIHWAPRVGLEPTTSRLTAVRSTIELSRNI